MDDAEKAIAEAESWLDGAKAISGKDRNVGCAMAIHSIIRANDALCLRFLGRKATRHDDAHILFGKLIGQGKIPESEKWFQTVVSRAMHEKSGADYGKTDFTRQHSENMLKEAEGFLKMARKYLPGKKQE